MNEEFNEEFNQGCNNAGVCMANMNFDEWVNVAVFDWISGYDSFKPIL